MQCIRNFYHTLSWELYLRFLIWDYIWDSCSCFLWIWISVDIFTPPPPHLIFHLVVSKHACGHQNIMVSVCSQPFSWFRQFKQAYRASVWTDTIFCDWRKRFTLTLTSESNKLLWHYLKWKYHSQVILTIIKKLLFFKCLKFSASFIYTHTLNYFLNTIII